MKKTEIPRITKIPLEVQATEILRDLIIRGVLPPGERITETDLAERMGLSRSSIRTALHQLARDRLTSLIPYTGWTVMELTSQDAWELYTLRASIERLAGQLTAKSINEEKKTQLTKAYEMFLSACRGGAEMSIDEADFFVHETIISLTNHSRLVAQYQLIERQVRRYIHLSDALIPDPEEIVEQHRPIVEAILAGDAEQAGWLSEQHNLTEGEKLVAHLVSMEKDAESKSLLSRAG